MYLLDREGKPDRSVTCLMLDLMYTWGYHPTRRIKVYDGSEINDGDLENSCRIPTSYGTLIRPNAEWYTRNFRYLDFSDIRHNDPMPIPVYALVHAELIKNIIMLTDEPPDYLFHPFEFLKIIDQQSNNPFQPLHWLRVPHLFNEDPKIAMEEDRILHPAFPIELLKELPGTYPVIIKTHYFFIGNKRSWHNGLLRDAILNCRDVDHYYDRNWLERTGPKTHRIEIYD